MSRSLKKGPYILVEQEGHHQDLEPRIDDFARFRGSDYRRAQWKQVHPRVCHREHGGS